MAKHPVILGLNTVYHETSACVLRGPELLAFAEQERLNRVKKGKAARVDNPDELPVEALLYCLEKAGVTWGEIDRVAVSFDPGLRSEAIDEMTVPGDWGSRSGEARFLGRVRGLPSRLSQLTGIDFGPRWRWIAHERAHAASAYFASPFEEAAVLAADGIGESTTASLGHGVGGDLREIASIHYPHSLGFLWEKICKFLGFDEYDAGKVMALTSFGAASDLAAPFSGLVTVTDGSFEVAPEELLFRVDEYGPLERRFGPRRARDGILGPRDAAVAAALQSATEEILGTLAERLHRETGSENLCLAGGVMLNCVALGRLLRDGPFANVFVQPIAHDAGTALGAALAVFHEESDSTERWVMKSPYLGPEFFETDFKEALQAAGIGSYHQSEDPAREAAQAIADGKIIGWFQGAAEAGPRALGNRSILADPRTGASKELINLKAKHREYFRPFAPAVLKEHASEWFEVPRDSPSLRFMSFALPVRPEKRQEVPAIVHVDGTGRLQVVGREINPLFHELVSDFHEITGVPMVVNTSFNTFDEPMVCSPADAVKTFTRTDLDLLFLGDLVVRNPRVARRGGEVREGRAVEAPARAGVAAT